MNPEYKSVLTSYCEKKFYLHRSPLFKVQSVIFIFNLNTRNLFESNRMSFLLKLKLFYNYILYLTNALNYIRDLKTMADKMMYIPYDYKIAHSVD